MDNVRTVGERAADKLEFFTPEQAAAFLDYIERPYIVKTRGHNRTDDTGIEYAVGDYERTKEVPEQLGKVRSGQVRVLLGSTSKMGAGTNVQDRLVAIHDVDCPWRPGDLQQRKGRIERQGSNNLNQLTKRVHETGRIYDADLEDLRQTHERMWDAARDILSALSKLKL